MAFAMDTNRFYIDHEEGIPFAYRGISTVGDPDNPKPLDREASYRREQRLREEADRLRALEMARLSGPFTWRDGRGVAWEYLAIDSSAVRIIGCEGEGDALIIPDEIDGMPVRVLASESLAGLSSRTVICPDGIQVIEPRAFRSCSKLRTLRLPHDVSDFESTWYYQDYELEELYLPGLLESVDVQVFDARNLKRLYLGEAAQKFQPGCFEKSTLEEVAVDPRNPFISTDGRGIYSADGSTLIALAVPGERYRVQDGTRRIEKKAFSSFSTLVEVDLPDSVEEIAPFALSRTGISTFKAPAALRELGEKAFYRCRSLTGVNLNEGLRAVGDEAFSGTPLAALRLPASVENLGILGDTKDLRLSGDESAVVVEEGSRLSLDGAGGLYRREDDGLHFVRQLDASAARVKLKEGTRFVDDSACLRLPNLAEAVIPEGVERIGASAFRDCRNLTRVSLPSTLAELGPEAFLDTGLTRIALPAALTRMGENALVTAGAHHEHGCPSLKEVTVDPENPRYFVRDGLLTERWSSGKGRVLLYLGSEGIDGKVVIPPQIVAIAPYAFNGARDVRELHLSDQIQSIGVRGLSVNCFVELIHIDLAEPYEGHTSFDIRFPDIDRSPAQIALSFSRADHIDPKTIYKQLDNLLINAKSMDGAHGDGLSLYEQATRLMERLLDPVFLLPVIRDMAESFIRQNIVDICLECARHDDRSALNDLVELGFLNRENIVDVIDHVVRLQDAAMTGYLLELKRERFDDGMRRFDSAEFDL